ncbi:MAG: hypothetical protein K9G43_01905 [Rhodobacteraceae bacterium]|nr:hypothetical protein [Paracoccaceae bacterium]
MLRTILVGSCVSVQGLVIAEFPDGKIMVKVDDSTYVGFPVPTVRAA